MANMNGVELRDTGSFLAKFLDVIGVHVAPTVSKMLQISEKWYLFWAAIAIALFAPTAHEFTSRKLALDETKVSDGAKPSGLRWQPSLVWACIFALMGGLSLLFLTRVNSFIYFQF